MKKNQRLLFITLSSVSMLISGRAQTTKSDPAEPIAILEKFTVSTRGETRANNTIQMADVALTTPGKTGYQLLDMLPGVNITGTDNFGLYEYGWRIRVRAFNINAIAVALDGIPMGNNAANGGNPVTRFFDSENLSSIVVSQGTGDVTTPAYEALGGSMNFYTRAPKPHPGVELAGTYGSHNLQRETVNFDTGSYTLGPGSVSSFVSGSNTIQDVTVGKGQLKRKHYDVKLNYQDMKFSVTGIFSYNDRADYDSRSISGDTYGNFTTNANTGPGDLTNRGRNWSYLTALNSGSDLGYYYDRWINARTDMLSGVSIAYTPTSAVKITAVPYYQDRKGLGTANVSVGAATDSTSASSAWGFYNAAIAGIPGRTDVTKPTAGAEATAREEIFSGYRKGIPVNASLQFGNNTAVFGGWYEDEAVGQVRTLYNIEGGKVGGEFIKNQVVSVYYDRHFVTKIYQFFAKDTIKLLDDKLAISAGVRSLKVDRTLSGLVDQNAFFSQSIVVRKTSYSDKFQPQVGATYELVPDLELFANYSESFASPTKDQLAASNFNASLKPEQSTNIDVGARYSGRKVSASLAAYHILYKDRILSVGNFNAANGFAVGTTVFDNVGNIEGYGTDIAVAYKPMTNLMVNTSLSYQALTFNDNYLSGTTLYATKNKVVPNTPKWTIDTDVSYYKEAFFVTMGGKFVANSYMTSTNNQSLPGYTIFTLGFGYDGISKKGPLKNVKIAFNIDNVFDRYYYYSASDTGPTNGSYYAGLPRAYYLTVTGKF